MPAVRGIVDEACGGDDHGVRTQPFAVCEHDDARTTALTIAPARTSSPSASCSATAPIPLAGSAAWPSSWGTKPEAPLRPRRTRAVPSGSTGGARRQLGGVPGGRRGEPARLERRAQVEPGVVEREPCVQRTGREEMEATIETEAVVLVGARPPTRSDPSRTSGRRPRPRAPAHARPATPPPTIRTSFTTSHIGRKRAEIDALGRRAQRRERVGDLSRCSRSGTRLRDDRRLGRASGAPLLAPARAAAARA